MNRLRLVAFLLLPLLASLPALADEKIKGYAEYRRDGALIVEGQMVRATSGTRFDGPGSLDDIPLGYEVEVRGERRADGTLMATRVEARPNGDAMFETDVLDATNEIEREWVQAGRMYEPLEDGSEEVIGRLVRGNRLDRVTSIARRLTPPYVDFDRQVRVYLVQTDEWNAAAMGNGAIWVYSGLVDAMTDDELAIVIGHEIAHFTHEHSRREAKSGMWHGLAGLGAILVGEVIGTDVSRAVAGIGAALGMTVWSNGYSRDLEDQADKVGLRYAREGGFDVAAGPTLWAKFRDAYGEPDEISNFFLGSHSRPSDRIENIQREIRLNYPDRTNALPAVAANRPAPAAASGVDDRGQEVALRDTPEATASDEDYVGQVEQQLDALRGEVPAGYESTFGPELDEMGEGEAIEYDLPVEGDTAYLIVGVCDVDCDDLDLLVTDQNGNEIALDFEPDDYPVLSFVAPRNGTWFLEVSMAGCATDTCVYGVEIYSAR